MPILPALEDAIEASAAKYDVPPEYLRATAMIESAGGYNMRPSSTGAQGPFQFTEGTARAMGLDPADRMNIPLSTDAAARLAAANKGSLERQMGHPVTWDAVYLAHQQGAPGAAALLNHPDQPATSLVKPQAILVNGGNSNMTGGDFAKKWMDRYNSYTGAPATLSLGPPGTTAPTAPAVGGAPASTVPATAATAARYPGFPMVMTPQQSFDWNIGQALSSMGSGGGGGGRMEDPVDQPAIRMPALEGMASDAGPNPLPPQFAGGGQFAGSVSSQLASTIGQEPDPTASITAGAPSMTQMLGTLGTPSNYNMLDPRATQSPSLTMRGVRMS